MLCTPKAIPNKINNSINLGVLIDNILKFKINKIIAIKIIIPDKKDIIKLGLIFLFYSNKKINYQFDLLNHPISYFSS